MSDLDQRRRSGKRERDGHYAIVWVDGPAPAELTTAAAKSCTRCDRDNPGGMLHHDPRSNHPGHTICARCQGEINRERMGGPR